MARKACAKALEGTNSLSINDIPKAILALQKAYAYLMERKDPGQPEKSSVGDLYG